MAAVPVGDAGDLSIGPGRLWVAPVGTAPPADATTDPAVGWEAVGYTEEGSTIKRDVSSEDIKVAEELERVRTYVTEIKYTVAFSMAEVTRRNLALAFSASIAAADLTADFVPPEADEMVRVALMLDQVDPAWTEGPWRWVFYQAFQTGTSEMPFKKAPDKTLIPVEFSIERPSAGGPPFTVIGSAAGAGTLSEQSTNGGNRAPVEQAA